MDNLTPFISYLLSAIGLTILIVWPNKGPSAFLRDRVARALLPCAAQGVLDCYICCGFWCGAVLGVVWWLRLDDPWYGLGCLMVPGIFWLRLNAGD